MAMPRPSRKSKDAALAGLHNLTRKRTAAQPDEVEPEEPAMASMMEGRPAESDSDFEAAELPKSIVKSTARRPRGAATGESTGKRGRRGGAVREPSSRKKVRADTGDGEGSLFEIVKSGKTALNTVVDEWIEAYKQDRDAALLELIQFFIHCSGCRGRITPHMYHNMEHADIIRKMTEEFDEDSGDYPLIMTGPAYKKFKSNFCEFIHTLVHQCQYSIIYDQYMMDNVISLLTGLTDSQVRAFRHTSTLASMKLMTALVDVALNVSVTLDHTQRQYDAERSKAKGKQASDRLENLIEKRKEAEENQEEIRHMLTYIFKGVFVHRYRDSQAEIRAICTTEIGVWMKNYPGMFLDDSYLKYIGWTLYDRVGEVRLCCLKCLQPLYDSEELAPKLELFTNRFKDRIVEMTLDKEYDVSVQAVKLVISILKCNPSVLTDKDCENVYELVYSSHRGVAQAAGEFLNAKLFAHDLEESPENQSTKKGKKRSENTPKIRDLVLFFIESELHEHGSYLVDSLWDVNDMLKDWECMTDLLLEEAGPGEEALDDRQETSLIEIMVCCVKQAATGDYPIGRGPTTRRPTTKEARQVADDKTKLTEHFIVTLPQLLGRYVMDEEKVANLLQIPLYFELEIYVSSRQEKNLDLLLRQIANIVEKHSDSEVLENCSKVLEYFVGDANSIKSRCLTARDTLVDKLVDRYRQAMTSFFEEGEEPDEDDTFALLTSLKRLFAFWSCHDLNPWMLWESHSYFLSCSTVAVPDEILCKAVSCCHMSIMWQLEALDSKNPSKEGMKALQSCLTRFMNACSEMLDKYNDIRQEEAYLCICDMLIIFSHSVAQNSPQLEPLVYDASKELQQKLTRFLNEKVFIEDDDDGMDENKKIEELHKRRNFLASFCKLIVYNIIKIKCATDMFKYYMKFYNDYGDIIKATLGKAREINKVQTAKTLALSLTQLYRELQEEQPVVDRSSESFLSIKELARRFSLSFGLDQVKIREAVAAMHKEGIQFVVNTSSFPFLEILSEFSGKLMKQDKKVVLSYLDSCLRSPPDSRSDDYAPLASYRHTLLMGETDTTVAAPATGVKRGRGAKRKLNVEAEDTTVQYRARPGGRTPAHSGAQPPLTLSVTKRPHIEPESASEADVDAPSERDYESSPACTEQSWLNSQKKRLKRVRKTEVSYAKNSSKMHNCQDLKTASSGSKHPAKRPVASDDEEYQIDSASDVEGNEKQFVKKCDDLQADKISDADMMSDVEQLSVDLSVSDSEDGESLDADFEELGSDVPAAAAVRSGSLRQTSLNENAKSPTGTVSQSMRKLQLDRLAELRQIDVSKDDPSLSSRRSLQASQQTAKDMPVQSENMFECTAPDEADNGRLKYQQDSTSVPNDVSATVDMDGNVSSARSPKYPKKARLENAGNNSFYKSVTSEMSRKIDKCSIPQLESMTNDDQKLKNADRLRLRKGRKQDTSDNAGEDEGEQPIVQVSESKKNKSSEPQQLMLSPNTGCKVQHIPRKDGKVKVSSAIEQMSEKMCENSDNVGVAQQGATPRGSKRSHKMTSLTDNSEHVATSSGRSIVPSPVHCAPSSQTKVTCASKNEDITSSNASTSASRGKQRLPKLSVPTSSISSCGVDPVSDLSVGDEDVDVGSQEKSSNARIVGKNKSTDGVLHPPRDELEAVTPGRRTRQKIQLSFTDAGPAKKKALMKSNLMQASPTRRSVGESSNRVKTKPNKGSDGESFHKAASKSTIKGTPHRNKTAKVSETIDESLARESRKGWKQPEIAGGFKKDAQLQLEEECEIEDDEGNESDDLESLETVSSGASLGNNLSVDVDAASGLLSVSPCSRKTDGSFDDEDEFVSC